MRVIAHLCRGARRSGHGERGGMRTGGGVGVEAAFSFLKKRRWNELGVLPSASCWFLQHQLLTSSSPPLPRTGVLGFQQWRVSVSMVGSPIAAHFETLRMHICTYLGMKVCGCYFVVFHVLQLLPVWFTWQNLCCNSKFAMEYVEHLLCSLSSRAQHFPSNLYPYPNHTNQQQPMPTHAIQIASMYSKLV